ncbi:MAG: hypothetical protein NC093_01300 [Alistipes sp.]|nr:hypothetical protein [Alistipes sp.]
MRKQLIICLFSALTIGTLAALNAGAAESEAESSIMIDESNSVSLASENAGKDGITAIQMSLRVETAADAKVSFGFNQENNTKITEYRYHDDTDILNIYMADPEPLFKDSDIMELGSVMAEDLQGNPVDVRITATEDSVSFVSQNNLTSKTFIVKNESEAAVTEQQTETSTVSSGEIAPTETTTTTAAPGASEDPDINSNGKNVIVRKTVNESYEIVIPEGTGSLAEGQTFDLTANNVKIPFGKKLNVAVTSFNGWTLNDKKHPENNDCISYSMGFGDTAALIEGNTETILSIGEGVESGTVKLTVLSVGEAKMAGTFADTLTFSVDVS